MNALAAGAELFAVGALLGADQTAGPQAMLSQPLVAGAIGGMLCGEPRLGLAIGLVGQAAWNGAVPVGSRPNPDVSSGTLAGVLTGALLQPGEGFLRAAFAGAAVALLAGWAGMWPIFALRRANARWTRWAEAAEEEGERLRRGAAAQRLAWIVTAAVSGIWVLLAAGVGVTLAPALLARIPRQGGAGGAFPALLWGLGLGSAALTFARHPRKDWRLVAAGMAGAALLKAAGGL